MEPKYLTQSTFIPCPQTVLGCSFPLVAMGPRSFSVVDALYPCPHPSSQTTQARKEQRTNRWIPCGVSRRRGCENSTFQYSGFLTTTAERNLVSATATTSKRKTVRGVPVVVVGATKRMRQTVTRRKLISLEGVILGLSEGRAMIGTSLVSRRAVLPSSWRGGLRSWLVG
ncbi:unnamed protein product [Ectocarpus sp. 12 AP-2014]